MPQASPYAYAALLCIITSCIALFGTFANFAAKQHTATVIWLLTATITLLMAIGMRALLARERRK